MSSYGQFGEANITRVLPKVENRLCFLRPNKRIGFVRVCGREVVTIAPYSERVLEGLCRVPPKVKCQVLIEASPEKSVPRGLLIASVLAKASGGRIQVRMINVSDKAFKLVPKFRVASVCKPQSMLLTETVEFEGGGWSVACESREAK